MKFVGPRSSSRVPIPERPGLVRRGSNQEARTIHQRTFPSPARGLHLHVRIILGDRFDRRLQAQAIDEIAQTTSPVDPIAPPPPGVRRRSSEPRNNVAAVQFEPGWGAEWDGNNGSIWAQAG